MKSTKQAATQTVEERLAKAKELRDSKAKEILSKIEPVYYFNGTFGDVGFGYQEADGLDKLVEFNIPAVNLGMVEIENNRVEEISLGASLEWLTHVDFAEVRFDICLQTGPGWGRWIQDLHTEVA
jgi:hypothetical protein